MLSLSLNRSLIALQTSYSLWADRRLVYAVAAVAVTLLLVTIWLFRRQKRQGRQAGIICLIGSVVLHLILLVLVPYLPKPAGGAAESHPESDDTIGIQDIEFSSFDPEMQAEDHSQAADQPAIAPLPVSDLADSLVEPELDETVQAESDESETPLADVPSETETPPSLVPPSLAAESTTAIDSMMDSLDADFQKLFEPQPETPEVTEVVQAPVNAPAVEPPSEPPSETATQPAVARAEPAPRHVEAVPVSASTAERSLVAGAEENDFANRVGRAKTEALIETGGNLETEAAVAAALKYLTINQRPDGAWDPRASGAGKERQPLGMNRGGAGARAETALTGLALLSLMGAGQTHQQGEYADNVYRGLAYLIQNQKPDGSLSGNASVYAATYAHGMAALAMCEAAAITRDASAIQSAKRAMQYTQSMQHSGTGGWRYTKGDTGDLSQLGWQAMVLDAGSRAGIQPSDAAVRGMERFLRSVRSGRAGGLASYRGGEAPSRTMTAEALATRLLIGQTVPQAEIDEAEMALLQQKPGVGQDNYYYWYYATLALHQLQDEAWEEWNRALQSRLLSTQLPDGQWPTESVWGGYGGSIYTTSMATLCLESYYRHTLRESKAKIAQQPAATWQR
ncbi:putative membrane protein [Rhodopirellula maiorica SM1]|uniref:Putative membrane protein n=1 Tax=Rhodopirellula maiorica SM1 TaxID=1265738 RepID=M5RUQ5_9BACT|nr:putative membrane protein [Rhodopirellula maiorica]EMI23030.1 putative membrane protein [Rhodopirellula maiorica SM1]